MKAHTISLFKFFLAACTAFIVLNLFCLVYYKVPGHISSKSGATDYVYPSKEYYSQMAAGYGYGRMNNEGFNNLDDYHSQTIDILLMGSSHIEGLNVSQTETMVSVLNESFDNSQYVYNIGFSTHNFYRNINNLEGAITYYRPKKYIFCEITDMYPNIDDLENMLNRKMEKLPSFDNGLASYLQKIPYMRLGYRQVKFFTGLHVVDMLNILRGKQIDTDVSSNTINETYYSELLDLFMRQVNKVCSDNGVNLFIFYHPRLTLNPDGSASTNTDAEYLELFKIACDSNDIYFVDMTGPFMRSYNERYLLPHGFWNTHVGEGHLNKNGHRIIAEELYKQVQALEKSDTP
jgi:hypothetical protein